MLPATGEPIPPVPHPEVLWCARESRCFLATLLSALVVVLGVGAVPASAEGESIFGFMFQDKGQAGWPTRASRSR